ncbi:MAG: 2-hydroxyglutaryl-CoA dehydratase [Ruminococcaceae bacterium]|nr:2-hydroxyglutaryl-CoA dehydratase [Oscillospiraceae bacterium]
MKKIGLDVGSTTLKCVILDENDKIVFSTYKRHFSKISQMTGELLSEIAEKFSDEKMQIVVSGSAGMGMANDMGLPFVQEVYATRNAVRRLSPQSDVVIELGGEDAKILFITGGLEVRMNGTCAGGTGAFIDRMASLLSVDTPALNELAKNREKIYTIASRCGVFAKSDVQPLINQGARKEDIAASIFYAVVNQTIAGLAQGREIKGNILYLGGPLTFLSELRLAFDDVLKTHGACPENSLYFVAYGAAVSDKSDPYDLKELSEKIGNYSSSAGYNSCEPLFTSEEEYEAFIKRHKSASEGIKNIDAPADNMYLGIDAGSTTVKILMCDDDGNIFRPLYCRNDGKPVEIVRDYLEKLYRDYPEIKIRQSAVTGYGEDIIRSAFHIDHGIVETIAHYTAAKKFKPDVDFILDIGGQDIKCFKIRGGAIDNIFLNEACSSGCGSFLQTFAAALGYSIEDFANLGLYADRPVDLGSRCTVFMNSSVKQAQKDGATVENISAGLSISVVKNALYKVIRCASAEELGKNIVVQGGTFLNNAVLRSFEQEIGHDVIRPEYSAVMGAYGAALFAKSKCKECMMSNIISKEELKRFSYNVKAITCKGCTNRCRLTINTFSDGERYIAGNRCDKPIDSTKVKERFNLYAYKNRLLESYADVKPDKSKKTIGLPMGLNMYELLPFWATFFRELGFNVKTSPVSNRKIYLEGQHTIPSDTVCYPAKLLHGHIEELLSMNVDAIFYPGMSYNFDEGKGDNHFNCPVVAYYPQVIEANVKALEGTKYICDFIGVHDKKEFEKHIAPILSKHLGDFSKAQIHKASESAYSEYASYMENVRKKGEEFLELAKRKGLPVIVLCGRPYHLDPEINHGIDELICNLGAVVLTEDSVSHKVKPFRASVRNQWTYHARLYAAAKYVAEYPRDLSINLIQLVSFGCGVDAVTTDEVRSIIEEKGKIYTQIKIDEISNMGAVKIRLRSLFAAAVDRT